MTLARLRAERPNLSRLLLKGFQAESFPISADDFHGVLSLLGEDPNNLPAPVSEEQVGVGALAELEKKYLHASPEVKERINEEDYPALLMLFDDGHKMLRLMARARAMKDAKGSSLRHMRCNKFQPTRSFRR